MRLIAEGCEGTLVVFIDCTPCRIRTSPPRLRVDVFGSAFGKQNSPVDCSKVVTGTKSSPPLSPIRSHNAACASYED